MPIVKGKRRLGALVLENRLSAYCFTPERLEALQLIAGQAAARPRQRPVVYGAAPQRGPLALPGRRRPRRDRAAQRARRGRVRQPQQPERAGRPRPDRASGSVERTPARDVLELVVGRAVARGRGHGLGARASSASSRSRSSREQSPAALVRRPGSPRSRVEAELARRRTGHPPRDRGRDRRDRAQAGRGRQAARSRARSASSSGSSRSAPSPAASPTRSTTPCRASSTTPS